MTPAIKTLSETKLIGKRTRMSLSVNKTHELWRDFMPLRKQIKNNLTEELFSMQVYDDSYFRNFNIEAMFEKWAAVEVSDFDNVPVGMETYIVPEGLYAVFLHKGSSNDISTFQYIFSTWLPSSGYELDNRPHFEILGSKYKNNDPSSEEDIWIPIKNKN